MHTCAKNKVSKLNTFEVIKINLLQILTDGELSTDTDTNNTTTNDTHVDSFWHSQMSQKDNSHTSCSRIGKFDF